MEFLKELLHNTAHGFHILTGSEIIHKELKERLPLTPKTNVNQEIKVKDEEQAGIVPDRVEGKEIKDIHRESSHGYDVSSLVKQDEQAKTQKELKRNDNNAYDYFNQFGHGESHYNASDLSKPKTQELPKRLLICNECGERLDNGHTHPQKVRAGESNVFSHDVAESIDIPNLF